MTEPTASPNPHDRTPNDAREFSGDVTRGHAHAEPIGASEGTPEARPDPATARAFAIAAARLAKDDKCEQVVLLDVRGLSQVTDYLVIANGTSNRQMAATLNHIEDLGDEHGRPVFRVSKDQSATWLLADFVDVVVHLFEPNARAMYDLEMLWGDGKRVRWQRGETDPETSEESGPDAADLDQSSGA